MLPLNAIWSMERMALQTYIDAVRSAGAGVALKVEARPTEAEVAVSGSVAIIPLHGVMVKRSSPWGSLFGETSTQLVSAAIRAVMAEGQIKTIVLDIDSPGGSVDGLAELGDTIWEARQQKTVIAQITGTAASAAYYAASQATTILAGRMDVVGSIGTRLMLYDFSKAFEEAGIKAIPVDTGWFKSAGAMGTEITEEQVGEFQRLVDGFQADFLAMIRRGRGMTQSALKPLADGRLFLAREAVSLGLIDKVGNWSITRQKSTGNRRARQQQAEQT